MGKCRVLCISILLFVLINGCNDKKTEVEYYNIANKHFEKGEIAEALDIYKQLLKYYPTESNYFKIAYEYYNNGKNEEAIEVFMQVIKYYPNGEYADKSTFMVGFIYANGQKNYVEAKKYYEIFIEKYPDNSLVSSAKFELDNLGQDVNELPLLKNMKQNEDIKTE